MLDQDDLWLLDEELSLDEPFDVLQTMPEFRQLLDLDRLDDELGLRSILDRPETLSKAWWKSAHTRRWRRPSKIGKRHGDVLRAA